MGDTLTGPDFRLEGRVALLTGSGRGIGLGIARALAGQGCAVAIQDVDRDVAETEAKRIRAAGARAIALGGDVTDLGLPRAAVADVVARLGGLHVLVNNASVQREVDWLTLDAAEIERTVRADLVSPILFAQEAVRLFRAQRWGRVINIGSIQQLGGNPDMLPYAMSKAALANMTKALARRHAPDGITVNLIAPGWFDTWRNRGDFPDERAKRDKGRSVPAGRIGEPADVGGIAVLLCSEAGAYITGQSIGVDGGLSAR